MAQKLFLLSISLTFILYTGSFASENDTPIVNWLLLGPVETQLPIYHDQKNVRNESFTLEKLLSYEAADITGWVPENGATVRWSGSSILQWSSMQADTVELSPENEEKPANAWAAFYLDSDRFSKASLTISSHHPFVIYVNGHNAGTKQESESGDSDPGSHTEEIVLTQGKHLVLVRTLNNPEINASWSLSGTVSVNGKGIVSQSLNPERFLDLETLSNQPQLGSLAISADGSLAAMRISFPAPPDGTGDSWLEIRETASGNLLREYKGGKDFGSLQWAPEGRKFAYTESSDGKTSLWLADLETGSQLRLLKNVSDFGSYRWSPDGSFILYAVSERPDSDDSGVRLLNDLEERRPWHFTRSFLYKVNVPEGTKQRLTAGLLTTSLHDISPDGSTLLYSRSHTDYSVRPYSVSEYQLLNIETLARDSLFTVPFGGSGRFSPDGNTILFTGGPTMFGETGTSVPDGMVANDYDTQAYLYDIQSGDIRPISREFDPAIDQAMWGGDSNTIFMITTDQSYRNLYRYDVRRNQYTKINAQTEVLAQADISKDGRTAVYSGTGISQPVQAYSIDLRRDRSTLLRDPGSDYFKHVAFGEEKAWTFTTSEGRHIDGYVYYPPDFDPGKSYPVIANYYGGTVPVNRAFGGRYPKELYAAKGYIVYVMQPSGATGYGQEFSALHVNDWGIIVADEIIEGVNQFLDAHPYADRVTTPLLFLTGMQDTNVPPGESLQMYTALKLLGKETAFIAVDEQDHHILDYNKYKLWKASILSWFDKHLKGEPDWWEHKYGE